jgi:hypothetical protein
MRGLSVRYGSGISLHSTCTVKLGAHKPEALADAVPVLRDVDVPDRGTQVLSIKFKSTVA